MWFFCCRVIKIAIFGGILIGLLITIPAGAQDPSNWQETATGLSAAQNPDYKTAGLTMIVRAENWPEVSLQGGIKSGGYRLIAGPVGIPLGLISIPGSEKASITGEDMDWAHNEMTFTSDTGMQLKLWVSRLSPALLVETASRKLQLFTGDVYGNIISDSGVVERPIAPAYPKYVTYQSDGIPQVSILGSSELPLTSMDDNWMLLWYGQNSHFVETRMPLSYTGDEWRNASLPDEYAYQADAPILLVFQNKPTTIKHTNAGGVEITFVGSSGYIGILPVFGREHPDVEISETWSQTLPADLVQKANSWSDRLCSYPTTVAETYAYNFLNDSAIISESFNYLSVCSNGSLFAPIPPMLALVKDDMNISFSGNPIDTGLRTEFGPILGFENANVYDWRITGLDRYTDSKRILINTSNPPGELIQELGDQIQKVVQAGHFAPWILIDNVPIGNYRGDLYWANPADIIYPLIESAEVITGSLKSSLMSYIRTSRNAYSPEYIYDLDLSDGTHRKYYSNYHPDIISMWTSFRDDVHLKGVPLYNLYSLSRYFDLSIENMSPDTWQASENILSKALLEQDWATFYWFRGFEDRRVAIWNANRHFSGMAGYVRLADKAGDTQAEIVGRALLAKAAVLRLGLTKYPGYYADANLMELPGDPEWQVKQNAGRWVGYVFNYDFDDASEDLRQVVMMDQFGVYLYDHSGYMEPGTGYRDWNIGPSSAHLSTFRDITPELARFLSDFAGEEMRIYIKKYEDIFPNWYVAYSEGMLGAEHNLVHPVDSYQLFLAKSFIHNTSADTLAKYLDISWLDAGDLYYIHKLSETIRAYYGYVWDDMVSLMASAGDQSVSLEWTIYSPLPADITWQIEYQGPTGDQPSPIKNIPAQTRQFTLTGLTNSVWYSIKVSAFLGEQLIMSSDPVRVYPTKHRFFIPFIRR